MSSNANILNQGYGTGKFLSLSYAYLQTVLGLVQFQNLVTFNAAVTFNNALNVNTIQPKDDGSSTINLYSSTDAGTTTNRSLYIGVLSSITGIAIGKDGVNTGNVTINAGTDNSHRINLNSAYIASSFNSVSLFGTTNNISLGTSGASSSIVMGTSGVGNVSMQSLTIGIPNATSFTCGTALAAIFAANTGSTTLLAGTTGTITFGANTGTLQVNSSTITFPNANFITTKNTASVYSFGIGGLLATSFGNQGLILGSSIGANCTNWGNGCIGIGGNIANGNASVSLGSSTNNVFMGHYVASTGVWNAASFNVGIGPTSVNNTAANGVLAAITSGSNNTAVGAGTANALTTATNCGAFGYQAGTSSSAVTLGTTNNLYCYGNNSVTTHYFSLANSGTIETSAITTLNLFAVPTTLNVGAAATTVNIGATTGSCTIKNASLLLPNCNKITTSGSFTFGASNAANGFSNRAILIGVGNGQNLSGTVPDATFMFGHANAQNCTSIGPNNLFIGNAIMGNASVTGAQSATYNLVIGSAALGTANVLTSGQNNTLVGSLAATSITTGSNNTCFGTLAEVGSTANNCAAFGYQAGTASSAVTLGTSSNIYCYGNNSVMNHYFSLADNGSFIIGNNTSNTTRFNARGSVCGVWLINGGTFNTASIFPAYKSCSDCSNMYASTGALATGGGALSVGTLTQPSLDDCINSVILHPGWAIIGYQLTAYGGSLFLDAWNASGTQPVHILCGTTDGISSFKIYFNGVEQT